MTSRPLATSAGRVRPTARPAGGTRLAVVLRRALLIAIAFLFVALAIGVHAGGVWFDLPLLRVAGALRSPMLTPIFRAVAGLGSSPVLAVVATAAALAFARREPHCAAFVGVSATSAGALNAVLKAIFARARPSALAPLVPASGYAFPSGHAMASTAVYGAVLVALIRLRPRSWPGLVTAFVALVVAIGASRLYLAVHYPSDVLAGWALGAALPLWLAPLMLGERGLATRLRWPGAKRGAE